MIEVSAEATGRALFSTAMGDLNPWNDACCFERRLRRLLQYATIWKAVVLIDEADVFLEARSEGAGDTADRNSLVAVFLRNLEYFSGIVFLTSNRVHVFDQAMKSRIHLALEYTPPNIEMRKQIWVKTFSYIPPAELGFNIEDDIDILGKDEVNGREITNTANTARTLARFKGEKLQRRHLETVMNVRRDFENGIRKTQDLRLKHESIEVAGNSTPHANAFNSTL
jgi:SpoVK/Ycf46/Vps4 family AAA+-type ATPase